MEIFRRDIIFLHAPSVYDFRKDTIMFGPISDVIPSSATFEMYPIGITSIADTLEKAGFNVQIINLAYQMMRNPKYDVEKVIAKLNPRMFAIDLHWLPHAHGSIEIAKIVKKYHPNSPILFGGLSSSYYHEELINYDCVNFVIRGDSTEEPTSQLMAAIRFNLPLDNIPNLTWKRTDGSVVVNPLTNVPDNIDYAPIPSYSYVIRSVFKYANLHNTVPYFEWLSYPMTTLLTARGCTQNCSICGGSKYAYKNICNRDKPAFRSPKTLVDDLKFIQKLGQAPVFVIHDLRQGGQQYVKEFFSLLKKEKLKNELVIELFYPADDEFFKMVNDSVPKWSLQFTLETHIESIRKLNGKFKCTNQEIEDTLASAFKFGCRKVDIFFMTGIPKQTYEQAVGCVDYCRHLLEKFHGDKRISLFVAPLAPFLDPGSLAFENPEKYGYKKFCQTLADHRLQLLKPSWKHILSFETDAMTKDEIVNSTYDAALKLNQLKYDYNLIDQETFNLTEYRITNAIEVMKEIDEIVELEDQSIKDKRMKQLKDKINQLNRYSICGKDEMKWPLRQRVFNIIPLSGILIKLLAEELSMFAYRIKVNIFGWPQIKEYRQRTDKDSNVNV